MNEYQSRRSRKVEERPKTQMDVYHFAKKCGGGIACSTCGDPLRLIGTRERGHMVEPKLQCLRCDIAPLARECRTGGCHNERHPESAFCRRCLEEVEALEAMQAKKKPSLWAWLRSWWAGL